MINTEIIFFFIYCFIGWVCEEIYCSIGEKKIVYRGFLHGPYLPIYGFGAMSVLFLLEPFINNIVLLFIAGMISTSIIEYIGSLLLEKIFHIKLWDYSNYFFNINGRVCLLNSTLFGILSLLIVNVIHPYIFRFVNYLPQVVQYYLTMIIVFGMSFDFALSASKMASFNKALDEFRDRSEEVKEKILTLKKNGKAEDFVQTIRDKWNEEQIQRKARLARRNKRIINAFPSMKKKNIYIDTQLDKVREEFSSLLIKGKKQYNELKLKRKNYNKK